MIEVAKEDYKKLYELADGNGCNRVYPLSIVEGNAVGKIFTDSIEHPTCALFWQYCGFGYLAGAPNEEFLAETAALIRNERGKNWRRFVLQVDNPEWEAYFREQPGIIEAKRYAFCYPDLTKSEEPVSLPEGFTAREIDASILNRLTGRIIPSFSWESSEDFLKKGKGVCIMHGEEIEAAAFSTSISHDEIDIGIETNEAYRKRGLAVLASRLMVQKVIAMGRKPVWECHTGNLGSRRTAEKAGFEIVKEYSMFLPEA